MLCATNRVGVKLPKPGDRILELEEEVRKLKEELKGLAIDRDNEKRMILGLVSKKTQAIREALEEIVDSLGEAIVF